MNHELPVVLVTGAGRGIGAAIAALAASRGWRVAVADIDEDAAHHTAQAIGGDALAVRMDVADEGDVDRAFRIVEERWGTVTGLVNNAGYAVQTPFLEMKHDEWMREYDVIVSGAMHGIRRALPRMIEARERGASIVNIASVNGMGFYSHPTYSAAKAALISLTGSLASLFGHTGVRINAVAPGTVLTPLWGATPEEVAERTEPLIPFVPLRKMAIPEDIAETVLFLLSSASSQITGTTIPVDGGLTAGNLPLAHRISGSE